MENQDQIKKVQDQSPGPRSGVKVSISPQLCMPSEQVGSSCLLAPTGACQTWLELSQERGAGNDHQGGNSADGRAANLFDVFNFNLNRSADQISFALFRELQTACPDQCQSVLNDSDIDPWFLGFVSTYLLLSKLIPTHWKVVDFGCAYAPQAWYFRQHKKYIGVDYEPADHRFRFPNTEHYQGAIADVFPAVLSAHDPQGIFAICNYVPSEQTRLVREHFPNCFVFYPHGDCFGEVVPKKT